MDVKQKILVLSSLFFAACASQPRPSLDVKFYYPDHKTKSITRRVPGEIPESIYTGDKKFDQYIVMSQEDLAKFVKTFVIGCVKWKNKEDSELTDEELNILISLEKEGE